MKYNFGPPEKKFLELTNKQTMNQRVLKKVGGKKMLTRNKQKVIIKFWYVDIVIARFYFRLCSNLRFNLKKKNGILSLAITFPLG